MDKLRLLLHFLTLGFAGSLAAQLPVSTAFTYQGQLRNNGALVNGPRDFRVTLFDRVTSLTPTEGKIGNANLISCREVANGVFTLTLNFPDLTANNCQGRWLEIEVAPCGGSFQKLTPRVELLPVPYALQSLRACQVEPNGVPSAALQDGAVTGAKIADGTIAATDVNASTFGRTFWKADGNAGTTAGGNFIGTTDNQPLELKVNGVRALRVEPRTAGAAASLVGGYFQNSVGAASGAVIAGGGTSGSINEALGNYAFVGAGHGSKAGELSAVVGGAYNVAPAQFALIGGGRDNTNLANGAVIGGGSKNLITAPGQNATVGGGLENRAGGNYATVPGGFRNSANAELSFAAGNRAKANHLGSFVWADSQNADFTSSKEDEVSIRAAGGVRLFGAGLVSTCSGEGNGVQGVSSSLIASGVYGENLLGGYGVAGRSSEAGIGVFGENLNLTGWAGYFQGNVGVNGRLRVMNNSSPPYHAGVATEALSTLINIGLNDDLANRFGGSFVPALQGGFLRIDARPGAPLFGFFGRPAGVNAVVHELASLSSEGTMRLELGANQRLSLGERGSFEVDAPFYPAGRFVVSDSGNVGIGTPAPRARLSILNGGPEFTGSAVSSTLLTSAGALPDPVGAESTLASFGVKAGNEVSLGLRARRNTTASGWPALALGLTFDVDNVPGAGGGLWLVPDGNIGRGYVGIGTATPQARLEVADGDIMMSGGRTLRSQGRLHIQANDDLFLNPWGFTTHVGGGAANSGDLVVHGSSIFGGAMHLRYPRTFVEGFDADGFHWWGQGPGDDNLAFGIKKIGTGNFEFITHGRIITPAITITGGADLAEPFQMSDQDIPKGSLVAIDEEHEGKLKLASQEYDTRVAGIVSGANGINPGISLHQEGAIEGGQNVALSGRVYALADASSASIKPGDLLTSSSTPGHVMKVTAHHRAQGAIVGKAMSALNEGKGMVLVLVSLQ